MTYELTIGTMWKGEEDYAIDFIRIHRYLGVQKFIIFDREYDKLHFLIGHYPDVEIIHFPETPTNNHQVAWGQLIKYCQGKTKWLALIDGDQVLVPAKTNDIKDALKDYEQFASIQCNWKAFGSSGQEKKMPGSIYERFTHIAPPESQYSLPTQFICQPDRCLTIPTEEPHYPQLPPGEKSVNTNKEEIAANKIVAMNPGTPKTFNVPALYDVLWVAHYTNKSREEFLIKNAKGSAGTFGYKIKLSQFDEYDSECTQYEGRVLELWKEANK